MRGLVLKASPRRDGNSALLADAAAAGVREAGHEVTVLHLDDFVEGMLRDCRTCRHDDGACGIPDGYERLLTEHLVPADALVLATPLYWYGMSARLKSTVDRLFCFMSEDHPGSAAVLAGLPGKRVAVLIACEESYRGATLGLQGQFQELTRYLRQDLVGVVVGIGNSRGDVRHDPGDPLRAAADLGRRLFDLRITDYRFDTPRDNAVWSAG
ncbi:flavodoxin family protein [Geodermatophilus sabuli]|uniref:Flavodoxin-like fold n=1 Tax=Geodermatophilus sabuli TaxID=1564158 RepID=A0A285EGM9_9ACTN|nr:NAD(P)H-dependent oxidoreductase [Geodermatophilus sabuli]MBB3084615.1 multimeric flavodoxin WrbA [Geodermatophilus sabuli]SNX97191.1 Flavodoxin-like fold [Geodermatophilus sabuli]